MSYDLSILRAMLRLSTKREEATTRALLLRVGGDAARLRNTLRRLAETGLVERGPAASRLTMAGLAIAVSTIPPVRVQRVAKRRAA